MVHELTTLAVGNPIQPARKLIGRGCRFWSVPIHNIDQPSDEIAANPARVATEGSYVRSYGPILALKPGSDVGRVLLGCVFPDEMPTLETNVTAVREVVG